MKDFEFFREGQEPEHEAEEAPARVLLIMNMASGKTGSLSTIGTVIRELTLHPVRLEVARSRRPGDIRERVKQACLSGEFSHLVIVGGDGSVHEAYEAYLELPRDKRLPLGIIPTGTTCDYAKTLGIPLTPSGSVQALSGAEPYWVDAGRFNNEPFTYVASFGAFSEISYLTPSSAKNKLGHLAYVLNGIQGISNVKSYHLQLTVDEVELEGQFLFGAVTNTCSIGGLIRLNSKTVVLNDGHFELLLLRDPQFSLLRPAAIVKLLAAGSLTDDDEDVLYIRGSRFHFHFPDEEVAWTLDGEFGGSGHSFAISVEQQAVPVLLSPRAHLKLDAPGTYRTQT